MWQVKGEEVERSFIGGLPVCRVLDEFDFPLLYSSHLASSDKTVLVYAADVSDCGIRYVVSSVTDRVVSALLDGDMRIRTALDQPWVWIVDMKIQQRTPMPSKAWSVDFVDIPDFALPDPYVTLYEDLTPVLELKAEGPSLKHLSLANTAIEHVMRSARFALKPLAEHVLAEECEDYDVADLRAHYELSTVETKAASFYAAFRFRSEDVNPAVVQRMVDLLRVGLNHIYDESEPIASFSQGKRAETDRAWRMLDERERQAVLLSLKHLTPPGKGDIKEMTVGGGMAGDARFKFDRKSSKSVSKLIRQYAVQEMLEVRVGWVRAFDKDKNSGVFRGVKHPDAEALGFSCEPGVVDDVYECFEANQKVTVEMHPLKNKKNHYMLRNIIPLSEEEDGGVESCLD